MLRSGPLERAVACADVEASRRRRLLVSQVMARHIGEINCLEPQQRMSTPQRSQLHRTNAAGSGSTRHAAGKQRLAISHWHGAALPCIMLIRELLCVDDVITRHFRHFFAQTNI